MQPIIFRKFSLRQEPKYVIYADDPKWDGIYKRRDELFHRLGRMIYLAVGVSILPEKKLDWRRSLSAGYWGFISTKGKLVLPRILYCHLFSARATAGSCFNSLIGESTL